MRLHIYRDGESHRTSTFFALRAKGFLKHCHCFVHLALSNHSHLHGICVRVLHSPAASDIYSDPFPHIYFFFSFFFLKGRKRWVKWFLNVLWLVQLLGFTLVNLYREKRSEISSEQQFSEQKMLLEMLNIVLLIVPEVKEEWKDWFKLIGKQQ